MPVRLLRGTDSAVNGYYGSLGEVVVNQDNMSLHVLDGVNPGGDEIWNENQVTSYVNQAITSYASGGTFPTSSVTYLPETDFNAAMPNTTGTASDPNTEVIQWDGSKFYIAAAPAGGGGGGGGTNPTSATTTGSVMVWTGAAWTEDASFATQTYVNNEVAQVKTDILGGATAAYDTLQEIKGFIDTNASNIGTILTNVSTKITKPGTSTPANHAVAWDATANAGTGDLVNVDLSVYAPKPGATTTADHAMVWDTALGWQEVDLSVFALDADLAAKAIKPAASSAAGEFLRWDATANSGDGGFINQVPATGGGGTSIPTPSLDTDTANGEVLVWDQTMGSLKNEASSFAMAPPTQSTSDTYLFHDGTSWQYGTPVGTSPTFTTPGVGTASSEVLKWNLGNNEFENVTLSVAGFTDMGSITPPSASASSDVLQWDGTNNQFINQPGFATQTFVSNKMPAVATATNDVVKYNGTALENVALSTTGFTTTGFITPATTSGATDVLQWDGSNFINASGFAQSPPTQATVNTYLYHDGSSWQYGTPVSSGPSITTPTVDTATGEMLGWTNAGGVQNVAATTLGLATETYVNTAISNLLGGASTAYDTLKEIEDYILNNADTNMTQLLSDLALKAPIPTAAEVTADGEFLGWDGSVFTKKSVSVQGGAFNVAEVNGEIQFTPNYTVIDAATGVFDFTDNGTEYIISVKSSLAV